MPPASVTPIPSSAPYSLPTMRTVVSKNATGAQFQPWQLNSSGTIPGQTTIQLNGQGIVLSGPTSSITVADPTSQQTNISVLGNKGYILVTNPTTGINQMIIGKLPDGTYGIAISKPGVDVFSAFS